MTHCFHSHKAGLKTEHLGLHKALCVLMGWNWTISPDKLSYKKNPGPMIETLKEDLIIWPPIMIIRILSVMKTTSIKEPDLVTNNALRKILIRMLLLISSAHSNEYFFDGFTGTSVRTQG